MELYRTHRPTSLKQVIGQPKVVQQLTKFLEKGNFPHANALIGPSGVGKTTVVRILKKKLGCSDTDYVESNCADFRGIESIRDMRSRMSLAPMNGKCRIYHLDEAHKMTNDAQNAFLKMLEDTPAHVYFFLSTTEINKLIKTVKTRLTKFVFDPLSTKFLTEIVLQVAEKEGKKFSEEVIEKIVEGADGSARQALVSLHQILNIEDEDEQLANISSVQADREAIEIARALINPKTDWSAMAKILREVQEEPESIRYLVLAYVSKILVSGRKDPRCKLILDRFSYNFYDTKKAGLIGACYEVIVG